MPSTAELKAAFLDSIKPGVVLDDAFFRKLYGWSMTVPEFLETALNIAASRQVDIVPGYQAWLKAYGAEQEAIDKDVAEWYGKWLENQQRYNREGVKEPSKTENNSRLNLEKNLDELKKQENELRQLLWMLEQKESPVITERPNS